MSIFGRRQSDNAEQDDQPAAPQQSSIGFETVLGTSTVLDGKLESEGNIRLDGTFAGTLDIQGNVLVGETANIEADIDARNISIAGAVRGNVIGNKVQLLRTARVWGDIQAHALTIEEGAFVDGKISMEQDASTDDDATPAPPPAPDAMTDDTADA